MFQEDAMRVRIDGHAETEELTNETSMFQALDRSPSPSPLLALTCLQHSHREMIAWRRKNRQDADAQGQMSVPRISGLVGLLEACVRAH